MSIYKGNNMISGGSVDTHFVRKPAWSQAVAISAAQLYAGYTAPSDGMLVCKGVMPTVGNGAKAITVNNVPIVLGLYERDGVYSIGDASCPVNKDDLIKANTSDAWGNETRYFVPFEDSTVSDFEVVTPEYIRNQNILSDLEAITIGASSAAATTMQYDGFIIFDKGNVTLTDVYVNNVVISRVNNVTNTCVSTTVPVKKGDTVYITNQQELDFIRARFYKLRDYSGR